MALITCENLAVGYDSKVIAKNINFSVNKGDYICVIGENGTGKSTLIKTILGIKKQLSGSVLFGDEIYKGDIGYLPQQTDAQKDFPAAVKEVVMSAFCGKKSVFAFYSKEEKAAAKINMEKMGIAHLANKKYSTLSGGQQQRVLLARALCAADKILMLDEPVTGLDPKAADDMYETIKKLNNEGITIIMISHDTEKSLNFASHVLYIGKNTFFGSTEYYIKMKENKMI